MGQGALAAGLLDPGVPELPRVHDMPALLVSALLSLVWASICAEVGVACLAGHPEGDSIMLRRTLLSGAVVGFLSACQRNIAISAGPQPRQGGTGGGGGDCDFSNTSEASDTCGTVAVETVPLEGIEDIGGQPQRPTSSDLAGLKVALDVGHSGSGSDRGAFGNGISEYDLNVAEANLIARQLRSRGAVVSLFHYPQTTELDERGRNAAGHNIFVSVHHNAFADNSVQGTEILVGTQNQRAADQRLASAINGSIVRSLWGASPGALNRGARAQSLGVLRYAPISVQAKCLTEAFFVTTSGMTAGRAREMVEKAGRATADAIASYWLQSKAPAAALSLNGNNPAPDFVPWPESEDELGLYEDH